jgi:transposase
MDTTTVAIDLAKSVFEIAVADSSWRITERRRLSRQQLERFFSTRGVSHVVMEACGSSHHWGRWLQARGIQVSLLPAQYVRAYVRRDKTDRTDAAALLEAVRCGEIRPVCVKSIEQQALQGLHRVRSVWTKTRTARINSLRALCREFGMTAPAGARRGLQELVERFAEDSGMIPALLRPALCQLVEEIRALESRIHGIEAELRVLANQSDVCRRLQTIPGVGLLGSTALLGSVGDIHSFDSARRFACWVGLTPREFSSGNTRRLGRITRQGDCYIRMLLIHGARAVLHSGRLARRAGRPLDRLREWALRLELRSCHNKAVVAIANQLARIVWATWHRERDFEFRNAPVLAA